ncbi:MAG: hypothetical protein ABW213_13325 [Tardiphaga sp.]
MKKMKLGAVPGRRACRKNKSHHLAFDCGRLASREGRTPAMSGSETTTDHETIRNWPSLA